jgi:hypothetical protein
VIERAKSSVHFFLTNFVQNLVNAVPKYGCPPSFCSVLVSVLQEATLIQFPQNSCNAELLHVSRYYVVQSCYRVMCVCVRGGPIRPLHRDLQWSIAWYSTPHLNCQSLLILTFPTSCGFSCAPEFEFLVLVIPSHANRASSVNRTSHTMYSRGYSHSQSRARLTSSPGERFCALRRWYG